MGCIQSSKQYFSSENENQSSDLSETKYVPENRPELTEEHKQIVRETWTIIKLDISKIGVVMFMR